MAWTAISMESALANQISLEKNVISVKKDLKTFPNVTNVLNYTMITQIANLVPVQKMEPSLAIQIAVLNGMSFAFARKTLLERSVINVKKVSMAKSAKVTF